MTTPSPFAAGGALARFPRDFASIAAILGKNGTVQPEAISREDILCIGINADYGISSFLFVRRETLGSEFVRCGARVFATGTEQNLHRSYFEDARIAIGFAPVWRTDYTATGISPTVIVRDRNFNPIIYVFLDICSFSTAKRL